MEFGLNSMNTPYDSLVYNDWSGFMPTTLIVAISIRVNNQSLHNRSIDQCIKYFSTATYWRVGKISFIQLYFKAAP